MILTRVAVDRLDDAQCEELLGRGSLGRLGLLVAGHPEIIPVHYVFEPRRRRVVLPMRNGTVSRAALAQPEVAFEVDDPIGWSVLVVGEAELVIAPDVWHEAVHRLPSPWVAGTGPRWIEIVPHRMTGRRLRMQDAS